MPGRFKERLWRTLRWRTLSGDGMNSLIGPERCFSCNQRFTDSDQIALISTETGWVCELPGDLAKYAVWRQETLTPFIRHAGNGLGSSKRQGAESCWQIRSQPSPAGCIPNTDPINYATLFFAAYEDAAREMCNINCGHNPPMLLPKRGASSGVSGELTRSACRRPSPDYDQSRRPRDSERVPVAIQSDSKPNGPAKAWRAATSDHTPTTL